MRLSLTSRAAAVLSGVLLLQLLLLASGTLCRMHAHHADMSGAAMEQRGEMETMVHAAHAASVSTVRDASAASSSGACDMIGSCGSPWAPSGGCASMTSCVTAVSAIVTVAQHAGAHASNRISIVAFATMPLGPAFAPEIPPPRA